MLDAESQPIFLNCEIKIGIYNLYVGTMTCFKLSSSWVCLL